MKEIHLITKNTNEFTLGISIENIEDASFDLEKEPMADIA